MIYGATVDREIPEPIQSLLRIEELPPTPEFRGYISEQQAKDLDPRDIPILTAINQQALYVEHAIAIIREQNKQLRYLEFEIIRRRTNSMKAILGVLTGIAIAVFSAWIHSIFK